MSEGTARLSPLFTWRSAVCDSDLPPTARHVALTLSLHMNERGGSCFPSREELARETGLSVRTVDKAIRTLEDAGWLHVERPARQRGRGHPNRYTARVPGEEGRTTFALPTQKGESGARKGEPRSPEDVKEDVRYTPPESPSDSLPPHGEAAGGTASSRPMGDAFAEFWRVYPRRVGKRAARAAFERAARRASVDVILEGARRFAADPNLPEPRFVPHPATWLNQDRWEDDPLPPRADRERSRGDPGGRNRAFTILEQAARMREERLRSEGVRAGPEEAEPRPALELVPGGGP